VVLLKVGKEQLRAMNETELATFAWESLGIRLDPSWSKSKMLTQIVRNAVQVVDRR
jgi:hypothetical protein